MTIERLQAHYGFTRMPFGRALPPQMLHRHASHAEAAARIGWCISEHALGVVTGEVGAGKTVGCTKDLGQGLSSWEDLSMPEQRRKFSPQFKADLRGSPG